MTKAYRVVTKTPELRLTTESCRYLGKHDMFKEHFWDITAEDRDVIARFCEDKSLLWYAELD